MAAKYYLFIVLVFTQQLLFGQILEPDLQDQTAWTLVNRTATPSVDRGAKAIDFNELPGTGLMILKEADFSNCTIELDIKGNNKIQQSFVGIAFHLQNPDTYDAVYFRPFNFQSEDAGRSSHAVQYISMPENDWESLRNRFPGKYENKIEIAPSPADWFHVKVLVNYDFVSVFVNDEQASLTVQKLNSYNSGGFALWLGNNSGGSFANLRITKEGE